MKYVAVVLSSLLIISCSKSGSDDPSGNFFTGGGSGKMTVQFDSSVYSFEQTAINKDLENISKLNLTSPPTGDEASYFQLSSFNGASLSGWLKDRVKYIIGEYYSESQVTYASLSTFNTSIGELNISPFFQASTVMQNTGTGYWLEGKKYSRLYKMKIGGTTVEVRGPRVGVIQIGEALFDSYDNSKSTDALVNSLRRISTYFHEARHSDGNGTHAGFPHAKCTGGAFDGEYACEQYLNGPYMLQAALLDSFYRSCDSNCDSSDEESLRLMASDKKSRLTSTATYKDPTPERLK